MKVLVQYKDSKFVHKAMGILEKHKFETSAWPDVLISIGGDGTYLHHYKKFRRPILPIRTSDSLGYISDIAIENLEAACEKLAEDQFYIEKRILLDAYKNETKIGFAINEVTISRLPTRAIRYSLWANSSPIFSYKRMMGDGVIIATPTGSTGSNRSADGYILDLASGKIVVTLKDPMLPNDQREKSKILDEDSIIRFEFYDPQKAFLIIDNEPFRILNSDKIIIKKSDETFDLVRIRGMEESIDSKERRRDEWIEKQEF